MTLKVVLADDGVIWRDGLGRILTDADFDVVGLATDAEDLVELVRQELPDIAIIDIRMPPTNTADGLVAALRIRDSQPQVGVLLLSQYVQTQHVMALMEQRTGGFGYLLKENVLDLANFIDCVRAVGTGGLVVDAAVISQLVSQGTSQNKLRELTDGQHEVLKLMAEGRTNSAIAKRLCISHKTVEKRINDIFSKLGLEPQPDDHRRVLAVLTYLGS